MYDNDLIAAKLRRWDTYLAKYRLPDWEAIPDIGLAQLAMHSCYETAGTKDIDYMIDGMKAFYETDIECAADGEYKL